MQENPTSSYFQMAESLHINILTSKTIKRAQGAESEMVTTYEYLGVIINHNLLFKIHIEKFLFLGIHFSGRGNP